jgi:hypothetical protein
MASCRIFSSIAVAIQSSLLLFKIHLLSAFYVSSITSNLPPTSPSLLLSSEFVSHSVSLILRPL